ncbi:MAG TPA: SDR family oxidoreductase [Gaiellaceae bacterium]|nr:SDR family oxidoreductase [Gaiellaceae bacterium]
MAHTIVVGGTSGIGRVVAESLAARGDSVVVTGRDADRAGAVAAEIGPSVRGLALELARPAEIAAQLETVDRVDSLVIAAIERDENTVRDYDADRALRLVTLKLVGYTEVVHALAPRLAPEGAIVLFGGLAKERPYPGSTTVTTVNGAVSSMVRTLALELKPARVNAIHPGVVGDSPAWSGKPQAVLDALVARTPIGRLATMGEVAQAVLFLLDNGAVNGVNLDLDGGWLLT